MESPSCMESNSGWLWQEVWFTASLSACASYNAERGFKAVSYYSIERVLLECHLFPSQVYLLSSTSVSMDVEGCSPHPLRQAGLGMYIPRVTVSALFWTSWHSTCEYAHRNVFPLVFFKFQWKPFLKQDQTFHFGVWNAEMIAASCWLLKLTVDQNMIHLLK